MFGGWLTNDLSMTVMYVNTLKVSEDESDARCQLTLALAS